MLKQEIMNLGVMMTPALAVDGQLVETDCYKIKALAGGLPAVDA